MNATLLIHAIVRQTMVLIAVLATAAGRRTPLASVADQVFSSLVRGLSEQGLGHKVIADMFGMALRTYHRRAARISESDTDRGRSLWEAVLTHLRGTGPLLRAEILERFPLDNELVVRSVLRDLVESGLVYQTGRGDATSYRAADAADLASSDSSAAADQLLLVAVHKDGPTTERELRELIPLDEATFSAAMERLSSQRLVKQEGAGNDARYRAEEVVIPLGAAVGWEAAVLDHYQAMVAALVTKLRVGQRRAILSDKTGGSTFTFDVWQSHPLKDRVLGYLQAARQSGIALRAELEGFNAQHEKPDAEPWLRVTAYVGQSVKTEEEDDDVQE